MPTLITPQPDDDHNNGNHGAGPTGKDIENQASDSQGAGPTGQKKKRRQLKPGERVIFRWHFKHPKTGKLVYPKNGRPFPIVVDQHGNYVFDDDDDPPETKKDPKRPSQD